MSHLSPYEVGQVKAHLYYGLGPPQIAGSITKADGKTLVFHSQRYSLRTVNVTVYVKLPRR